ncbi:hypothetical protein PR202_ga22916 [Eleusine coracana subsp. coracana]|uniref:PARP catalytic domain-containing protein n=1 Tax=Eleusine coracana subsp. coracana TaxID=191504 RepID=A0AAV5D4H2_ELECO|nr:hypothetical protein PR202_ga22916 [Eleusine coracana subsp. coracana]
MWLQGSLLYNEYIVYNVDQIKMRYALHVSFKPKRRFGDQQKTGLMSSCYVSSDKQKYVFYDTQGAKTCPPVTCPLVHVTTPCAAITELRARARPVATFVKPIRRISTFPAAIAGDQNKLMVCCCLATSPAKRCHGSVRRLIAQLLVPLFSPVPQQACRSTAFFPNSTSHTAGTTPANLFSDFQLSHRPLYELNGSFILTIGELCFDEFLAILGIGLV